ncbi:ATP-binding cassette domain-containing protein [Acidimicrobiia bacterium EGI L10123]|uniref:ABC transporter ATP-binding protein n=1 Tax=Salinilacustrithrix flava TaxID=2957203 RepID=UPI003D7C308D|nr:ATP-binding cassette domain-containing protein [Acidimicrobiia bacterium EGI L10123]
MNDQAAVPAGTSGKTPLLEVDDLEVAYRIGRGRRAQDLIAVSGVSFHIDHGETFAVVGESGSGKSTTARAITRTLPVRAGNIRLGGRELTELSGRELRRIRSDVQMVFQDPYSSLNPSMLIRDSIAEPLRVHTDLDSHARDAAAHDLIQAVGLLPEHLNRYPYEFSGGQRQRIAIARAIATSPSLVICDEALSALDVSTQNQIIRLLEEIRQTKSVAYLFIAHDLAVVRHIADRVGVMYLGRMMESGPTERVYNAPAHPYTEALLSAVPVPHPRRQRARRRMLLPGDVPNPLEPPSGCVFRTRCPRAMDICAEEVPMPFPAVGGGEVACHLHTSGPELGGESVRVLSTA